ncbi:MAG TPA: autorepressor SdpR family transcription factor [Chitinophagaceae bacterium]
MNRIFKALNDRTRREILELLKKNDLTAGEISDHFNFSKPTISHHLNLLRQAELVISVKKGQYVCYSLNTMVIEGIIKWLFKLNG